MSEKLYFRDENHGGFRDGYLIITSRCQTHDAILFICNFDCTANTAPPL